MTERMAGKSPTYKASVGFTAWLVSVVVAILCFSLWRDRWYADAIGGAEFLIAIQVTFKALLRADGGKP